MVPARLPQGQRRYDVDCGRSRKAHLPKKTRLKQEGQALAEAEQLRTELERTRREVDSSFDSHI